MVPVRLRIIVTEVIGVETVSALIPQAMMLAGTHALSYYYRPSHDRIWILFGGRHGTVDGDRDAPTQHLYHQMLNILPQLQGIGILHSWFGYVAMNRDMVPRALSRGASDMARGSAARAWSGHLGLTPRLPRRSWAKHRVQQAWTCACRGWFRHGAAHLGSYR